MKGVRYYIFSTLLLFVVLFLLHPALSINANILSSKESLTISSNRTIVSPGDDFELGFFKTSLTSGWYLGIWYKKVPERPYAWVANRDNPLSDSNGTLKISDNNLVIVDQNDKLVWSTDLTERDVSSLVFAELLSNGNFVMRYSNNSDLSGFLWQSFDFPTDTLLPEMKLGYDIKTRLNRYLTSWRSLDDLSRGNFSYKLATEGLPEFLLWLDDIPVHRSGPWNGIGISGLPEEQPLDYMVYNFTENTEEVVYMFIMTNHSIYSRLTLTNEGVLHRFTWIPPAWGWKLLWSSSMGSRCEVYQACGAYSYCDTNTSPQCNCIKGFSPWNMEKWELRDGLGECVRRTQLSCNGDGFLKMEKMKLPDTTMVIVDRRSGLKQCKEMCPRDCNCTAYANYGCQKWWIRLCDLDRRAFGYPE